MKTDRIVFCPLTNDQKSAYKRLLAHEEVQKIINHDEPCPCGATDERGYAIVKISEETVLTSQAQFAVRVRKLSWRRVVPACSQVDYHSYKGSKSCRADLPWYVRRPEIGSLS